MVLICENLLPLLFIFSCHKEISNPQLLDFPTSPIRPDHRFLEPLAVLLPLSALTILLHTKLLACHHIPLVPVYMKYKWDNYETRKNVSNSFPMLRNRLQIREKKSSFLRWTEINKNRIKTKKGTIWNIHRPFFHFSLSLLSYHHKIQTIRVLFFFCQYSSRIRTEE